MTRFLRGLALPPCGDSSERHARLLGTTDNIQRLKSKVGKEATNTIVLEEIITANCSFITV